MILSKNGERIIFWGQLVQKQHLDLILNGIKHYGKNSKDENIAYKLQNFSS